MRTYHQLTSEERYALPTLNRQGLRPRSDRSGPRATPKHDLP